jgi:hypothetical protein
MTTEKKEQYYKQVFIRSESDLPTKEGSYIFGWDKTGNIINSGILRIKLDPEDDAETQAELCEYYDWYLLPIPQQEPETKTGAREFLIKRLNMTPIQANTLYAEYITACEEYASQFKLQSGTVTDQPSTDRKKML